MTEQEFSDNLPKAIKDRIMWRMRDMKELIDTNQYSGLMYFCNAILKDLQEYQKSFVDSKYK
jgi:hypothetical protein